MQLVYQLDGPGWASVRVSDATSSLDMEASYLSDALGDMAMSALQLLRGVREASFSFQDEPGEHRWTLSRGEADLLHVRIFWSKHNFNERFPGRATEVFACDCAVLDFVGQVSYVLQTLLIDEGLEGYRGRWRNHDFPLGTFTEIQRLLTPRAN
jgi:hypothetical protein